MPAIADEVVPTLLLAATRLTGHKRRRFQAEVALQYCGGSARRAESAFGWGRDAVRTGPNELRSGIRCVEDFESLGRKATEAVPPELEGPARFELGGAGLERQAVPTVPVEVRVGGEPFGGTNVADNESATNQQIDLIGVVEPSFLIGLAGRKAHNQAYFRTLGAVNVCKKTRL